MVTSATPSSSDKTDARLSRINLPFIIFLAAAAALGGLLFGFDIAIITGAGPFLVSYFHLGDIGLGVAFSSLLFGCVIGSYFAGRLTDRFGRKRPLIAVGILFGLTSVWTGLAGSFPIFLLARTLAGFAVGAVSLLSPMYVAEISPPSIRGRMGALYQMSIITGILISYGINFLLRNTGPMNWRWMFLTGVIPSAVFVFLVSFAPESPRFLVLSGDQQSAAGVLARIGGLPDVWEEVRRIAASVGHTRTRLLSATRPGVRRAVLASVGLAILVHVSGINTIVDYAPSIFLSAGWNVDGALGSTLVVGFTEFVFTLISFWAIDRFGRKPLYLVGSTGMAISLVLLSYLALTERFHGELVLALILFYLANFAACIGPAFWTLVSEIFPNDVRGAAMTVPVLVQWIANAIVVLLFPYAFHSIGKMFTLSFLAIMCVVQAIYVGVGVPETKNLRLEEVESCWTKARGLGKPVS
jgi:sugar porter (SP) family MFS transporter